MGSLGIIHISVSKIHAPAGWGAHITSLVAGWGAHRLTAGGEKPDCALGNLSNFWQPLLGRLAGPGEEEDKDLAGRTRVGLKESED